MSLAPSTERLHDEELLVIRESARLMGKSLDPGLHPGYVQDFAGHGRGDHLVRALADFEAQKF